MKRMTKQMSIHKTTKKQFLHNIKIVMPFYSRHSSDGRDRLLGDIHDGEEYGQFMNIILIGSNFTDAIQSHYHSSDADVLPPLTSEKEKIDKTKKYQKKIPS